jgi:hypothetical protein
MTADVSLTVGLGWPKRPVDDAIEGGPDRRFEGDQNNLAQRLGEPYTASNMHTDTRSRLCDKAGEQSAAHYGAGGGARYLPFSGARSTDSEVLI